MKDHFGYVNNSHFEFYKDYLFVSRLTTLEVSVDPRTGRGEQARDVTRDVGTKCLSSDIYQ